MKHIQTIKMYCIVLCLLISSIRISAQGRTPAEQRRDVGRAYEMKKYYDQQNKNTNGNSSDESSGLGWLLLGGIFVAGMLASQSNAQSQNTTKNSRRPIQHVKASAKRPIAKAPILILSASTPIFKTNLNEHLIRNASINYDLKGELLLLAKKGESVHFGLYGTGTYADHRYKLPYYEKQYALGHQYIQDGVAGSLYMLNQDKDLRNEINFNTKFIQLRETSWNAGLSLKTFFKHGFLIELGSGVRFQRNVSMRFTEGDQFLTQGHQLKQSEFNKIAIPDGEPLIFNIPNSYVEAGLGFFGKSKVYIKVSGRLFNIDYQKTDNFSVFWENEQGEFEPIKLDHKTAYHIQIALGLML